MADDNTILGMPPDQTGTSGVTATTVSPDATAPTGDFSIAQPMAFSAAPSGLSATSAAPVQDNSTQFFNALSGILAGISPAVPQQATTTTQVPATDTTAQVAQPATTQPVAQAATTVAPATTTAAPQGGLTAAAPMQTQAGTQILGPQATIGGFGKQAEQYRYGTKMYTSDGQVITNPIVSDYQKYGLTPPTGTPTTSVEGKGAGILGGLNRARQVSTNTDLPANAYRMGAFGGKSALINPYAAFNQGQDITKPYLDVSGNIVLPGGNVVKSPTAADYAQYGVSIERPFDKSAYSAEEKKAFSQIKSAGKDAASILYDQLIAEGVDQRTAQQMANSVKQDYATQAMDYRNRAYLPQYQTYDKYFTQTPEEYLGSLPDAQKTFRPTAQQIFDSLSPTQQSATDVSKIKSWLDANPDYKITLTPEMIKSAADSGAINLGTKLIGVDYDALKTEDPAQLKAINEATNKYNLGLHLMHDYGLMQQSTKGDVTTGLSIPVAAGIAQGLADGSIKPDELSQYLPKMGKGGLKRWTDFGNAISALRGDTEITSADLQQFSRKGKEPQLVKGTDDIYTISTGKSDTRGQYVIVQKTGDDSWRFLGGTAVQVHPSGGGFFSSFLPVFAGLGLTLLGVPGMIGSAITGGSGLASQVIGSAITNAALSGLSGGDPLKGLLTGGLGAFTGGLTSDFLGGLNIAGLPLNSSLVNTLASTAGNLATSPITGQPINPSAIFTNLAGSVIAPQLSSEIKSALPSDLSPNVANAISGGLAYGGLNALTGASPPNVLTQLGTAAGIIPSTPLTSGLTGAISGYMSP